VTGPQTAQQCCRMSSKGKPCGDGCISAERAVQEGPGLRVLDHGEEPNFGDADYQLGAYAAALEVLTRYGTIDGRPVAAEVLRERQKGEESEVERLLRRAVRIASDFPSRTRSTAHSRLACSRSAGSLAPSPTRLGTSGWRPRSARSRRRGAGSVKSPGVILSTYATPKICRRRLGSAASRYWIAMTC
jgi:hypothetical protein